MPSAAEWSSQIFVPSDKNVTQNTRPSLYTYTYIRFGTRLLPIVLRCCWSLHPNYVLNLHLRHSCTFAYNQTGRTFIFLTLPYSLPPVSMTTFSFGCCVKLLHKQNSISLMVRHLSQFLSNMLLAVSTLETANNQRWVHDYNTESLGRRLCFCDFVIVT